MHNRSKHTYRASLFFLILILLFGSSCLLTGCSGGTSSKAEANAGHSGGSNADGSGGSNADGPGGSGSGADGSGSDADSSGQKRTDAYASLVPTASGETCYGDDSVSIDASNISDGYVMVRYTGHSEKAKAQITIPDGTVYTYTIKGSDYNTFPLTGGNGDYTLKVYEWVVNNSYALAFSQALSVSLNDEFKPFLYPNQYVWFTGDSQVIALGRELSDQSADDLDYVQNSYYYVIRNISYDNDKAENTPTDYVPDIDTILEEKKGICFDYASLMAALLRSQSIPTKLEVGYSGEAYHAWISVYLTESGWVDNIIEFDGKDWVLMDPTLAANNSSKAVAKYIGDGSKYTVKYSY